MYVNCGHNPPILIKSDGIVQHLSATASVLGAFADWECAVQEAAMNFGDTLVLFTDGITEAASNDGEEFGEERLIDALREHLRHESAQALEAVTRVVQEYGGKDQADDLTMIVARVVEPCRIQSLDVKVTEPQYVGEQTTLVAAK